MTTTKKPYTNLDRWYVMSKRTDTAIRGPYKTEAEANDLVEDSTYVKMQNLNTMTIHPRRLDNETDGI